MLVKTLRYNIILTKEPEGGFTVTVPALPGCVSYGKTLGQAKSAAQDAIAGYLTSLKKHGEPIPNDENSFVSSIELKQKKRSSVYA